MTEDLIGSSTLPALDELRRYDAVCVLGPTACGKTSFAVALALAMGNVEILSADSRQVYRRMDIEAVTKPGYNLKAVFDKTFLMSPADF